MGSRWESIVIDAQDPARLARWWAGALGYRIVDEQPDSTEIRPAQDHVPGLVFVPVPEPRGSRNGLQINLRPDDQEAEVERLVDMGARHVEAGPSQEPGRVVLADPEGNEFCVLADPADRPERPSSGVTLDA